MKNLLIGLIMGLACVLTAAPSYSEIAVPRFQKVNINLDGIPNEDIWSKATTFTDFIVLRTREKTDAPTKAFLCMDRENLYFAIDCDEPVEIFENKGAVTPWSSDNVEVFLANLTEADQWYRQIAFSTQMKRYNECIDESQYQLATNVGKNKWSAEMIIPLKALGEMPDGFFRFNVLRYRVKGAQHQTTVADVHWGHDMNLFLNMRSYEPATEVIHGPWTFGVRSDFVGVNWETAGLINADIFVRKAGAKEFQKFPANVVANTQQYSRKFHTAYLNNLTPDTEYEYHVGDNQIRRFRTLSKAPADFTFAMTNDIHSHKKKLTNILRNEEVKKADFLMINGDISSAFIGRHMCYDSYLDAIVENWDKAFYPLCGNHEYRGSSIADFFALFAPHTQKSYFSMSHKGVFFIVLDTDADVAYADPNFLKNQQAWLNETVKSKEFQNAEYRVLVSHAPFFTSKTIAQFLDEMPAGPRAKLDLILNAHVHTYCRVNPGSKVITSPRPSYNNRPISFNAPCTVLVSEAAGSIVVQKDSQKLAIRVLTNDGKLLDSLQVKKR